MNQGRHQRGMTVAGQKAGGRFKAHERTPASLGALTPKVEFTAKNVEQARRAAASLIDGVEGEFPQLSMLAQRGECTSLTGAIAEARRANGVRANSPTADERKLRADLRQARMDQVARAREQVQSEAERIRNTLRDAGVQYPANWDEMGSSEKDLWEDRQMDALKRRRG